MPVTIRLGDGVHSVPTEDAAMLAKELQAYAHGNRGDCENPRAAIRLAAAIDDRINGRARSEIEIGDAEELEALHRVLNAIVHEIGAAMELYNAVDMARRAA